MTGRARGRARGRGQGAEGSAARPGKPRFTEHEGIIRNSGTPWNERSAPPTSAIENLTLKDEPPVVRQISKTNSSGVFITPNETINTVGTTGQQIQLYTNFFKLVKLPAFEAVFQYNVTYEPQCESKRLRRALLHEHRDLIGTTSAFDGMILYIPRRLPEKSTTVFSTLKSTNSRIKLTITLTDEIPPESPLMLHLYGVIHRWQLKALKMQQIGRNFFSPDRGIDLESHNLQLWPGIITAISQYDGGTLLNADVSHKVMRITSVLDMLYELYNSVDRSRFHNMAVKKLVGETVITRYNNKTYRIDDIDWDKNPNDMFTKSDGTEISFKQYYEQTYSRRVTDDLQPLLQSNPKRKGTCEFIILYQHAKMGASCQSGASHFVNLRGSVDGQHPERLERT